MSAKVDECPAAGAPESLRLPKSRSSLLDVELSRATFVQKSEGFEVFRRKLVGSELLGEFVGRIPRVGVAVVDGDEPLLGEDIEPLTDVVGRESGVPGDHTTFKFDTGVREQLEDTLVGGDHPTNSRVHIRISHTNAPKSIPFPLIFSQVTGLSYLSGELYLYTLAIDLSRRETTVALSSVVLLQKRGDAPGLQPEQSDPGTLPDRTMSDARQPRKFSGSVAETPENTDFGVPVSLDIDQQGHNQLLAATDDEVRVVMFVDGDARREDVVNVLEDLQAEAEYLTGGRDA
jgi:hypothetical protein